MTVNLGKLELPLQWQTETLTHRHPRRMRGVAGTRQTGSNKDLTRPTLSAEFFLGRYLC